MRDYQQNMAKFIKGYNKQNRGLYTAKKHFNQKVKADMKYTLLLIDN